MYKIEYFTVNGLLYRPIPARVNISLSSPRPCTLIYRSLPTPQQYSPSLPTRINIFYSILDRHPAPWLVITQRVCLQSAINYMSNNSDLFHDCVMCNCMIAFKI